MLALKFIIDVGVGYLVDQWLVQNGYDVISVRDLNPSMDDEDILSLAVAEDRMVVTMDKDFGELVYKEGSLHAGILILRLEGAASAEKI
jgi:predicted nuclease of predicted toxin-antitoxin system